MPTLFRLLLPRQLLIVWLIFPSLAAAQKRVAVVSVEGPQGKKVEAELARVVKKNATLVSQAQYDASATRLFARSHKADDVAAVAGDLHLDVAITGKVKQTDAGWELAVSVRHGPTGKSAVKLRYPLKGPRVDPATLKQLAEDVVPAIETAAAGPGAESPESPEITPTGPDTTEESERPIREEKSGSDGARPSWAPWFDASAGVTLSLRSFGFDEKNANTPSYHSGQGTPGLRLDGTLYPLANFARAPEGEKHATPAMNALAGLGIGATYDVVLWGPAVPCNRDPSNSFCLPTVDSFDASEHRVEGGLRFHWNMFQQDNNRPELLAQLQYGQHAFAIQKRSYLSEGGPRDIGPPDVNYSYVTLGLGLRLPFLSRLALFVNGNLHVVLDAGPIQTPDEWGSGGAIGFRFQGGLEARLWAGLFLRVAGSFEQFNLSFNQPPAKHNIMPRCPCGTTGGASDAFSGDAFSLGYAY